MKSPIKSKTKTKWTPGHGGMKCVCCTQDTPNVVKRNLNRSLRRMSKMELKKEM